MCVCVCVCKFPHRSGYVTASMGKEAAMACTVAVESAIGNHYNSQLRELGDMGINDPELRQVDFAVQKHCD